jgi:hypothetical protein
MIPDSYQLLHYIMKSKNRRGSFPIGDYFCEHGDIMAVELVSSDKRMTAKKCFDNALAMALRNDVNEYGRYQYCEGYWIHHSGSWAPIDHAFVYDTLTQTYLDPTIAHDERGIYIGIKFPLDVILECHSEDRWKGSVIDTLWRGYPMTEREIIVTTRALDDINL